MREIAVTNHAVERYHERVQGSEALTSDTTRALIQSLVSDCLDRGDEMDHPGEPGKKLVPFNVGNQLLFIAIGPNQTTYPGQWAAVTVLFDRDLIPGETPMTTIGELNPQMKEIKLKPVDRPREAPSPSPPPPTQPTTGNFQFVVRIRNELHPVQTRAQILELLKKKQPGTGEVQIFEAGKFKVVLTYEVHPM